MAILRQIAQLGHPVLRGEAEAVADPGDPGIAALIEDMLATLAASGGVGIAAPQVYAPWRVVVVASRPTPRYPDAPAMAPEVLVNPRLVWASPETEAGWEGCLSVPGLRGRVARHRAVRVEALVRAAGGADWRPATREYEGFAARIYQHEADHLDGLVFLDRLASARDLLSEAEFLRQRPD